MILTINFTFNGSTEEATELPAVSGSVWAEGHPPARVDRQGLLCHLLPYQRRGPLPEGEQPGPAHRTGDRLSDPEVIEGRRACPRATVRRGAGPIRARHQTAPRSYDLHPLWEDHRVRELRDRRAAGAGRPTLRLHPAGSQARIVWSMQGLSGGRE